MNYSIRTLVHLSLLSLCAFGFGDAARIAPQTERMDPKIGRPGALIKVTGKALDKAHVDEVFLTDHRFDMKVKVLEQDENHITFRVPPFAKPGRLQLLLLTAGATPVYLEQPLFLQIESDEEVVPVPPVEISRKSKHLLEVASSGTSIQVPMPTAPASPATSASLEKSIIPLKVELPAAVRETASANHVPVSVPAVNTTPSAPSKSGSVPAQLIHRERVNYPSGAQAQRIEGAVELIAIIRTDGRVKDVKVVKGSPLLSAAAISSVLKWIYEPAYIRGQPIESEVSVVINFKRP